MERRTRLIAEVADNHGGDMTLAKTFIRVLAGVGVDAVKFQSWQLSRVRDPAAEPYYEWLSKAELRDEQHLELREECRRQGVTFLTTVFDLDRVAFLSTLGLESIKIGSGEMSDHALLLSVRRHFPHLIVSTGMHEPSEVVQTARLLEGHRFTLMHCVSIYPHRVDQANLSRMLWLRQFTPSVGFSDHAVGLDAAKMAIALGADYLERHAALGPSGPGRVNPWDTTPQQWEELVQYRDLVASAWGDPTAPLSEPELKARQRFIGRWRGQPVRHQAV